MPSIYKSLKYSIPFMLLSTLSYANKVGNGGDGILCKDKLELLDFYEAKVLTPSSNEDPFTIVKERLSKLEIVAPRLAKQYGKRLKQMPESIEFTEEKLVNIKDSQHLTEPDSKDCKLVQIAIRKNQALEGEKQFLFQKKHFEKLPAAHKAGLISHEIIYEHLYKLGESDSVKVRKINQLLYKDYSEADFWKLIRELRIPIYK